MGIEEYLEKSIYWQKHDKENRFFYALSDTQPILLRINDFPDEPLYTLICGLDILNLEEAPDNWVIPLI